jgi:hypothetical protein
MPSDSPQRADANKIYDNLDKLAQKAVDERRQYKPHASLNESGGVLKSHSQAREK